MGLGVGIALTAIGAILAFAVHTSVSGLDISVVGWILMGAGILGILLEIALFAPRRARVTTATYGVAMPARTVVHDDRF